MCRDRATVEDEVQEHVETPAESPRSGVDDALDRLGNAVKAFLAELRS